MQQTDKQTFKLKSNRLWHDDEPMALPLLVSALASFGPELLTWDPLTVALEVKDEFGVESDSEAFDKLMAAIQLLSTNLYTTSLPDFCRITLSLCGEPGGFLPDAGDCAWGMTEALLINPPEEDEPFSEEIRTYLGQVLNEEGILNPPDILRIALRDKGELLAKVQYDFSDDPEMFSAIAKTEQEKAENINTMVKVRTKRMLEQLKDLPIQEEFKVRAQKVASKLLSRLDQI